MSDSHTEAIFTTPKLINGGSNARAFCWSNNISTMQLRFQLKAANGFLFKNLRYYCTAFACQHTTHTREHYVAS